MRKGNLIVLGILLVGLLGYFVISYLGKQPRESFADKNFSQNDALRLHGDQGVAWVPLQDIDGDGLKETVTYLPVSSPAFPVPTEGVLAKEFSIVKHTKYKSFRVLHATGQGIVDERGKPLVAMSPCWAFHIEKDSTEKGMFFLFSQIDSLGRATSDILPVRFNSETGLYQAVLPGE